MWLLCNSPGKRGLLKPNGTTLIQTRAQGPLCISDSDTSKLREGPRARQLSQGPGSTGLQCVGQSASGSQVRPYSAALQGRPAGPPAPLVRKAGPGSEVSWQNTVRRATGAGPGEGVGEAEFFVPARVSSLRTGERAHLRSQAAG